MGLVLGAHLLASGATTVDSLSRQHTGPIDDYFSQEIFALFSERIKQALVQLSLLDEINVDLAREITGIPEIPKVLANLMENNCFVRSLDNDAAVYSFHHLFQGFLQALAPSTIGEVAAGEVLRKGAEFCLCNDMADQALRYLVKAVAYGELDATLADHGMNLIAKNRHATLSTLLDPIPQKVMAGHPWACLFRGLARHAERPGESITLLHQAVELFREHHADLGALIALGYVIYHYMSHEPSQIKGVQYLDEAHALFQRVGDRLPPYSLIMTAKNLGAGYLYFRTDIEKALHYCSLAEREAAKTGLTSLLVESRVMLGFTYLFVGECSNAIVVIERLDQVHQENALNMHSIMLFYFVQLKALRLLGNENRYQALKGRLLKKVSQDMLQNTIVLGDNYLGR